MMAAKLTVTAGPDAGKVFPLDDGTQAMIGRGDTAVVRLADPAVSRAHCLIACADGNAILTDNSSRSGTRVNGKTITQQQVLQPDDVISIGGTKLRFQLVSAFPNTAPAEPQEA